MTIINKMRPMTITVIIDITRHRQILELVSEITVLNKTVP